MDAERSAPQPVRVETDELVRLSGKVDMLAAALPAEVPGLPRLTSSPPGWAVAGAQAGLAQEVRAYLTGLAGDLGSFADRLRVAGLSYADRDSALARQLAAAGRRA